MRREKKFIYVIYKKKKIYIYINIYIFFFFLKRLFNAIVLIFK